MGNKTLVKNNIILFLMAIALVAFTIVFTNCKNNVNSMLEDYNSQFTPTEDDIPVPGPGDENFNPLEMLAIQYAVRDNESLNLYGPPNCSMYKWEVIDPFLTTEPKTVTVKYPEGFDSSSQRFLIYIPSSGLLRGVYQIKLTVKGNDQRIYEDISELIIYQHIVSTN